MKRNMLSTIDSWRSRSRRSSWIIIFIAATNWALVRHICKWLDGTESVTDELTILVLQSYTMLASSTCAKVNFWASLTMWIAHPSHCCIWFTSRRIRQTVHQWPTGWWQKRGALIFLTFRQPTEATMHFHPHKPAQRQVFGSKDALDFALTYGVFQ